MRLGHGILVRIDPLAAVMLGQLGCHVLGGLNERIHGNVVRRILVETRLLGDQSLQLLLGEVIESNLRESERVLEHL